MRTLLLLAAVHLLIMHQSQKRTGLKEKRQLPQAGNTMKPTLIKPASSGMLAHSIEDKKKSAQYSTSLLNIAITRKN